MFSQSKSVVYKIGVLLIIGGLLYTGWYLVRPERISADHIIHAIPAVEKDTTTIPMDRSETQFDMAHTNISNDPLLPIQRVNGVTIELHDVFKEDEYVKVTICYQLPNDADWLPGNSPGDVVLTVAEKTIPLWGGGLLEWKIAPDGTKTHRCEQLWFPIAADQDLSQFTITIKRLVTSIPEQPDCERAQEKLTQVDTGIQIQCGHDENAFGYTIIQKPSTMSNEEVDVLVYDAFSEIVSGPWVFTKGLQ